MTHFHEFKCSARSQYTVEALGFQNCRAAARLLAQGRSAEDVASAIGWSSPKVAIAAAEAATEYCNAAGWSI